LKCNAAAGSQRFQPPSDDTQLSEIYILSMFSVFRLIACHRMKLGSIASQWQRCTSAAGMHPKPWLARGFPYGAPYELKDPHSMTFIPRSARSCGLPASLREPTAKSTQAWSPSKNCKSVLENYHLKASSTSKQKHKNDHHHHPPPVEAMLVPTDPKLVHGGLKCKTWATPWGRFGRLGAAFWTKLQKNRP
jgi:hypothetical protein